MAKGIYKNRERTERRISAATSILLCALTVLAQIAVTLLLTHLLKEKASFVYGVLQFIGAVVAIRVYLRTGSPSYKLSWMCLLLALPVSGMILFCVWGGTHQAKQLSLKPVPPIPQRESQRMLSDMNQAALSRRSPTWGRLSAYLQKREFWLYRDTAAAYFGDGEAFFRDLIEHLRQAETYIFMEYYILAEGTVWDEIFAVLKERAAHGVEIHIIVDDFGTLTRLSDEMLRAMREAGIEVEVFNPVHKYISRIYFNYRDHRKITVIDGYVAYTGGINIGDEYANRVERFGHWKDSAVRLEGDGAWGLAALFMQMWKMLGRSFPNEDDFYRPRREGPKTEGFCQPFEDGPLNNPDDPVEAAYVQLIASAKRMVYLTTPYYAVEESKGLLRGEYGALPGEVNPEVRALAGIDPEEVITCRPADNIAPELEKYKEEFKDIAKSEEDVLSLALFPQVAPKFLAWRDGEHDTCQDTCTPAAPAAGASQDPNAVRELYVEYKF